MTCESAPCSACDNKSAATNSGLHESSAITATSEGPAGISMAVPFLFTNNLAQVTY